MQSIKITIDGKDIECKSDENILDVSLKAGIYIPFLCYHPDLPSFGACGLCAVEIEGSKEPVLACETAVKNKMKIITNSSNLKKVRQEKLAYILTNHPHACLVCAEKEGCAREPCSLNVPISERCCIKLGDCELERVADYIGIPENTPRYKPKDLKKFEDNPYITRDYNLCIGCGRCIRVCESVRGLKALGDLPDSKDLIDPSMFPEKLMDSGCQFCGLCIQVCPTGALTDRIGKIKNKTPCQENCPAEIDIPRFLRHISYENFSEALNTIYQSVPFPGTLGYVCNYPCESNCRRKELDDAVSIRVLKRFAFDQADDIKIDKIKQDSGKNVAIIGSGPSGLSCAFFLKRWGHNVTVFESKEKPGGMLRYGIPSFRLSRNILDKEIEIIKKIGVNIKLNTTVSSIDELLNKDFDAVFVGIGAQIGKKMGIPGEDDPRVFDALQFLSKINKEITENLILKDKIKIGKCVAVIGGGNTAIDAARTALRLGSKITLFYRRSEAEMPAYLEEVNEAKKEGINFQFLTTPVKIKPDKNKLKIEFIKMKLGLKDQSGRPQPIPIQKSNFILEFDNIVTAIGQEFEPIKGIKINPKGWPEYNTKNLSLGSGVYIGGDAIGPSSVVESITEGRKAAVDIHIFLGGNEKDTYKNQNIPSMIVSSKEDFLKKRILVPILKKEKRIKSFHEIELPLEKNKGIKEAGRCFQCDLCLYLSKVPSPPVKIINFIMENIKLIPDGAGVFTLFDKKKNIIEIKGTSNLRKTLEEKLDSNDKIKYFKYEEDQMYSKRESELLQQYIKKHGEMPSGGDELDDLF
jgi:NADPH-dependent glutamate synthase beta subunit-like oxidoreductase/ferredoxin